MRRLQSIIRPPKRPQEVPTREEWTAYSERLGVAFPADYQEYINQYGSGLLGDFIWILNPKARDPMLNFFQESEEALAADREVRANSGETGRRIRLFPEFGGLLPFGATSNGDVLYWRTVGDPDAWTVSVRETRAFAFEDFRINMSGFLRGLFCRELTCKWFPSDFPIENPDFKLPTDLI